MRVLFIGGTGQISVPCVHEAVAAGHEVTVFNRGQRSDETLPGDVTTIVGDMTDVAAYAELGRQKFDVVCQFIAFTPTQMQQDIATFAGNTGQYIFISSASVYEKPPRHYVITEETPAINPYWTYSQNKIACEEMVRAAAGLDWTIVRPSHTVRSGLPTMMNEGDLVGHRILAGKPLIVCGDGATPWTLTRSEDFAVPFVGLFGKPAALSEVFHITSDNAYTWDDIYRTIARGLGAEANIVHVPTETLVRYHADWEGPLTGDKTWAALFDNSKVKRVAGDFPCVSALSEVLAQPIAYFKRRRERAGPQVAEIEALMDRIAAEQSALGA